MSDSREKFAQDHRLETYKSMITVSMEGFKFLGLINGGAIVALLAYLGNASSKSCAVPDMKTALFSFTVGLTLCALGMGFAYWTQFVLYNESAGTMKRGTHVWFFAATALLFLFSMLAFFMGASGAVDRFR